MLGSCMAEGGLGTLRVFPLLVGPSALSPMRGSGRPVTGEEAVGCRSGMRLAIGRPAGLGAASLMPGRDGVPVLETTGRENARRGGAAAGWPAFAPSTLLRPGCKPSLSPKGDLAKVSACLCDIANLSLPIERESTMDRSEAAVKPLALAKRGCLRSKK